MQLPDGGDGCRGPGDCDYNSPVCNMETGKCMKCVSDLGCSIGLHCVNNECVCITAEDCRYSGGTCDPVTRQCLAQCGSDSQCTLFAPKCELNRGVCIQCSADPECTGKTFAGVTVEHCHNALCVQCVDDTGCAEPKTHCETREGFCVECLKSEHCPDKMQCFNAHCIPSPTPP